MPPVLLFAALGLALTCAPRSAWLPSLLALLATLGVFTWLSPPQSQVESIYLGCWMSTIATAAMAYRTRRLDGRVAIALSVNAGLWAAAVSLSGAAFDVIKGLPALFILFPSRWIAARYDSIPIKVVSGWIIAVAALAATLQFLPVTPGYLPDHLE